MVVAVDDRDRRAPHALARDQPVAQAVGDGAFAVALLLRVLDRRFDGDLVGRAVERAGVDHHAAVRERGRQFAAVPVRVLEHGHDRQAELLREVEVALVVAGHAHDGAGAVRREHVVGDPDWHFLAVELVGDVCAGEDARLLALGRHAVDLGLLAGGLDVRAHGVALLRRRDLLDERMLRREHEERHAEDRVRPRREDGDLLLGDARRHRDRSSGARPCCGRSSCAACC